MSTRSIARGTQAYIAPDVLDLVRHAERALVSTRLETREPAKSPGSFTAGSTLGKMRVDRAREALRTAAKPTAVPTDSSPACFKHAATQLVFALQRVPDSVDELVLRTAQRFIDVFGNESTDIRSGASADAHVISELVVRGLAQCHECDCRGESLDA